MAGTMDILYREMVIEDYDEVYNLWKTIKGFGIRSLDEISNYCNVSRSHLTKLFRANLHMSLQEYLIQFRINKSLDLLASTNLPVYQIAYHVGYENELNFLRAFKKQMGISPSTWRKQNKL